MRPAKTRKFQVKADTPAAEKVKLAQAYARRYFPWQRCDISIVHNTIIITSL